MANLRLERIRRRQAKRERATNLRRASKLAELTGQAQVVVRDRTNNRFRILPYAIRTSEPGGIIVTPKG